MRERSVWNLMAVDKFALTVGINQYANPNANLSGCVNDANDWADLLRLQGYQVTTLLDSDATKVNVLDALKENVSRLGYQDRFVFQYSGHGTWVPDRNGDEIDGRDEALVMHWMDIITDDDLFPIFAGRKFGSRVATISDSCHSGTVSRFVDLPGENVPRFLSPALLDLYDEPEILTAARLAPRPLFTNSGLLLSGCADEEFSYDAWFGPRANGAFTRVALNTYQPGMSYDDWHKAIRGSLPNERFPQSPQLVGTYYQRKGWKALD